MLPCPRRLEGLPDDLLPEDRQSHNDHWRNDGTCSHCGSVSPKRFFAAILEGLEIVPTDKSYKAYIRTGQGDMHKFYFQHLSERPD